MKMDLIYQGGNKQGIGKWQMMPEICQVLLGQQEYLSKCVWKINKTFKRNTAEEK